MTDDCTDQSPSNAVLAERIRALDKSVNDRFIALDKALQLAETLHKSSIATWISLLAIVVAMGTLAVLMLRH